MPAKYDAEQYGMRNFDDEQLRTRIVKYPELTVLFPCPGGKPYQVKKPDTYVEKTFATTTSFTLRRVLACIQIAAVQSIVHHFKYDLEEKSPPPEMVRDYQKRFKIKSFDIFGNRVFVNIMLTNQFESSELD